MGIHEVVTNDEQALLEVVSKQTVSIAIEACARLSGEVLPQAVISAADTDTFVRNWIKDWGIDVDGWVGAWVMLVSTHTQKTTKQKQRS